MDEIVYDYVQNPKKSTKEPLELIQYMSLSGSQDKTSTAKSQLISVQL